MFMNDASAASYSIIQRHKRLDVHLLVHVLPFLLKFFLDVLCFTQKIEGLPCLF
nr:MAG TPA: hypothetical protein [Caudoviricetes sp.]